MPVTKRKLSRQEFIEKYLNEVKQLSLDQEKVRNYLKEKLGEHYTDEMYKVFTSHFDSWDLSDIVRNQANYWGESPEIDFLLEKGLIENFKRGTKITDSVLSDLGINSADFNKDGLYMFSHRYKRTEAMNEMSKRGFDRKYYYETNFEEV